MTRFKSVKIALLAGVLLSSAPAFAGFEFTPASAPAKTQAPAASDANAPMQLVPVTVPPVAQMPLDEAMMDAVTKGPDRDPVLAKPVSTAVPEVTLEPETPVYVRRQKNPIPAQAQKAQPQQQPMDAEILLRATEPVEDINAALVIDPYPLENTADHSGEMTKLPVEQAMMEETGSLRPVGVPGYHSKAGMMARADISAKHDKGRQYQNVTGKKVQQAVSSSSMTPIPGGEGAPLKQISRLEEVALPPIAAKPAPRMPAPAPLIDPAPLAQEVPQDTAADRNGFTEAVGFGRDLPLVLALTQVVPADFNYAFAKDVNTGKNVSWQGGKPWNQVLDEMLAQNGLRAVIENNTITIQNANS